MRDYSILDNLDEGIQIIDRDFRYVYLNKVLLTEIRMLPNEVFGRSMVEKFPDIDKTEIYQKIHECLSDGGPKELVNEFKFPDGRHTFYEIRMQPIEEGVILFTRNITATKKGELLLQETNKELEQFAHIAAHDMREPVRRIAILCEELLIDHKLPVDAKAVCLNLETQAQALMQLISDFRSLSGIGSRELNREVFSMVGLAKEIAAPFSSALEEKGISIEWPADDCVVSAHPSLVSVLLRNLFENALTHGSGHLQFRLEEGPQTTFILSNPSSAKGPTKDVFLPFVTGDKRIGSGLGLAICKKVVTKHNGKIWSEQSNGQFSVSFTLGSEASTLNGTLEGLTT